MEPSSTSATVNGKPAAEALRAPAARKRRKPSRPLTSMTRLEPERQSQEARQIAAAVLEVLAGARTPSSAASALSVSLPRYYALEARALEGLLKACERRGRGPRRSAERELARLRRDMDRLQREAARNQALLRAAQRAVGLRAAELPGASERKGKKRRRRPVARALKCVHIFRRGAEGPQSALVPTAQSKDNSQGVSS